MNSIILAIQPKWCELIASGKKTIEVRKVIPNIPTPFKVYLYETKKKDKFIKYCEYIEKKLSDSVYLTNLTDKIYSNRGKVIGEFECDNVEKFEFDWIAFNGSGTEKFLISQNDLIKTCLTQKEIVDYACNNHRSSMNSISALHISNLKIYDKPRELGEFRMVDNNAVRTCINRERIYNNPEYTNGAYLPGGYLCKNCDDWCKKCKTKQIKRPPQSWMYCTEE